MSHQIIEQAISNALDTLFPYGDGAVNRGRVEHMLQQVTHVAATAARNEVLLSLLTSNDVAELLSISVRRVRAIARARHVGWQVPGTQQWLFLPEEIEALRPGPSGRPPK